MQRLIPENLTLKRWELTDVKGLSVLISAGSTSLSWADHALKIAEAATCIAHANELKESALLPYVKRRVDGFKSGEIFSYALMVGVESPLLVGGVDVWWTERRGVVEVGFFVHPRYRRQGIASWAVSEMRHIAFGQMHAESVEITAQPNNEAVIGLAHSLDFVDCGVIKQHLQVGAVPPVRMDLHLFTHSAEAWNAALIEK